ncbi:hypothetical protein BAE44_0001480 [Dichanthelium oligosanthes]|uniref:Uncharacterized protein n=1 Tax=Dichanthelium oligosanthes TaxID=888268 RepID=A0A1E5WJB8_9POAL|nr:hypothetical protein BAE44_0001480 [Dichanthelium oligosanthes]
MGSTADNSSALSPAVGAGRVRCDSCEGVAFTVTDGNEVAEVARGGGAARVLGSESFFDEATGTRQHFVDVQGEAEAMLFLVSVREDQPRIVAVRRLC